MPVFHYRAVNRNGETEAGSLESADLDGAIRRLQSLGLLPIEVGDEPPSGLMALLNAEVTPRDALRAKDRIAFTRSMATLTGAGLPLDRALQMTRDVGGGRAARAVAGRLLDAVRDGASLADAFDRESAAFPPLYRSILRAGEAGATLETTLARLADTLEDAARRRGELRSALIYPAFLVVTAIASVAVLLAYVVPTFEPLLIEAGVEPPPVTQAVIAAGRFVESYWLAALITLAGGLALFRLALAASSELRLGWHRTLLAVPIAGGLWRKFETARLTRLLGALLENGVALPASLRLVRGALGNAAFVDAVDRATPEVEAGRGVAEPLSESGLLPLLAVQLIQVGQESGQLAQMLTKTADVLEGEGKREFDQAVALLTPILTLLMGGLVAVIVSSILFALFSINELVV